MHGVTWAGLLDRRRPGGSAPIYFGAAPELEGVGDD
jgi:hypothetical protein